MKYIIYTLLLGFLAYSCGTTKDKNTYISYADQANDTIRIANDSLEYEIIIIEPGFNAWLVTQQPRGFYGENFLEMRNRQYVVEYNLRVAQPQRFDPNLYMQQINYEPFIHYGYEVNYLLYNYFLFFEQRYNQRFVFSRRGRGRF
ncbi:DUF6146 family protein [Aquimarina sp. MMG016]|uniref:DUF6146 family protein n=1 Tax=Aquimarina sp. MMG016 TaxID=2822690 RepID=UPI001B3A47B8|nr:DUF6146 family protein [Aquimarina sp. MMG016]MBQ4819110.1 hypothetical protein [Aquimarina sp. MMG016]